MTGSIRAGFDKRRLVQRGLLHYWRVNLAVLLGVAVGTAVLTGALLVGDSVRGSLRQLTLERLGRIHQILLAEHLFGEHLSEQLALQKAPLDELNLALPAIIYSPVSVERAVAQPGSRRRAGDVTLIASGDAFWQLSDDSAAPRPLPVGRQIVLNQPLADELEARIGDRLTVRLAKDSRLAGDSTLAEKADRVQGVTDLQVVAILPARGLGRFSLSANQSLPKTAYLPLDTLQQALDHAGRINAILISGPDPRRPPDDKALDELHARLRPTLDDCGLRIKLVQQTYWDDREARDRTSFSYWNLTSESMLFPSEMERWVKHALEGLTYQTTLTYLANTISNASQSDASPSDGSATGIPYSTVTALSEVSDPQLSPLYQPDGEPHPPLGDDQIVLNDWAATDLGAKVGDRIRLSYFTPESVHGAPQERSSEFQLTAVVPLTEPLLPYEGNRPARYASPPSRANDPDLTPEVPGITDQASIDQWDPPFPFDYGRIRKPKDEDYWERYRTTPKAFINQNTGRRLWGSRFGSVTSFRIASEAITEAALRDRLSRAAQYKPEAFGFRWLDVKRDGLQASRGTTPFQWLFLGFSMFLIASALMLVGLLFRLAMEQRARDAGLLLAVGFQPSDVTRLFLYEGAIVAMTGTVVGALLGLGYAALMLMALRGWWLSAVVTPFLRLHVGPWSLPLGALCGAAVSLLTIRWTAASLRRLPARRLLTAQLQEYTAPGGRRRLGRSVWVFWAAAVVLALSAVFLRGEAQAGAFFGGGACGLAAMLIQLSNWLRQSSNVREASAREAVGFSLSRLMVRNIARHPGRSVLTIGLMATACFLIVAISAFRLRPTEEGTAGFRLLAQSAQPIFDDLMDTTTRADRLGTAGADALRDTLIIPARLKEGDDASCRNLYQVQRPRIVGIVPAFISHFDSQERPSFTWADSAAATDEQRANPWRLLTTDLEQVVPVVLDKNTAMYGLHLTGGIGEEFELEYEGSRRVRFRVVGLLANSVLQGSLIVSEQQLLRHFPEVSGYQYFFIACPEANQLQVKRQLEDSLSDQGFRAADTHQLLADLLAVQNTYLSTFQSLGGLGVLLGTLGLAAVQLRSVWERRSELALLTAMGYSPYRIKQLVLGEHLILLLGGLLIGVLAALLTVLPHAGTSQLAPPWSTLLTLISTIVAAGLVTGYLALRPVQRANLVGALRGE
jgi:ABC-type antimicrobial peptide transport system permease subunit